MADKKYVYFFGDGKAEGRGDMKDLLGGKGANLADMTSIGLPVPPGFTITTEVDHGYEVLHISEASGPVLDDTNLGVEAFKNGVCPLCLEVVQYLHGVSYQHFSKLLHLADRAVAEV